MFWDLSRCSTVTGFWVAVQQRGFNSLNSASVMIIFLRPPRLTCHFAEGFKGRVLIVLFFVIIEYANSQETQQQKHTSKWVNAVFLSYMGLSILRFPSLENYEKLENYLVCRMNGCCLGRCWMRRGKKWFIYTTQQVLNSWTWKGLLRTPPSHLKNIYAKFEDNM